MSSNIKKSKTKRGRKMSLEESVKAMIISEYPLDSVVGSSEQCREAKKGILEYVQHEKPDIVFVDGLFSRIRYRETDIDELIDDDPLHNFMDARFDVGTTFLNEIKDNNPSAEVYYVFSDADEHNIRRLTHHAALKVLEENREAVSDLKKKRADLTKTIKKYRESDKKDEAKNLSRKKAGLTRRINTFAKNALLRMPNAESAEWSQFKRETEQDYLQKIQEKSPGVIVSDSNVKTIFKGYKFWYAHNWNPRSDVPLASRTNKLLEHVRKDYMGDSKDMPDFFLESGHHGEAIVHPYRHSLKDKYSLVVSSMVMEDQKVVKKIRDKLFKPELFQGKVNKIEACKRQANSKIPSPGISVLGKNKDGFYSYFYALDVLSKIGKGEISLDDTNFQDITILSDIHVGKGAVRYDTLTSAINKLEKEVEERVKHDKSVPLLFIPNESLQGYNYKSMPVETSRKTPLEVFDWVTDMGLKMYTNLITNMIDTNMIDKNKVSIEELGDIIKLLLKDVANMVATDYAKTNYPRIDDQVRMYFQLINDLVLTTLIHGEYEPSVVFNEGTHIDHTTGDVGISEVFLQTFPYKILEASLPILKKFGLDDKKLKNLTKKYLAGGYEKFEVKIGDNDYKFSTVHKPGSASPGGNIPLKQIQRAITMADDADVFVSAHLHTPFFYALGKYHDNTISAFYKGATFNEYDSYGKAGGWSPAVVGYEKALLPKDKGKKGIYGVQFVLSDVL